jgi:hypothetical protein
MVLGMGLIMVLLTVMVQFAMWQYVRASVRVAALDAARAASVVDATAQDCLVVFDRAVQDLVSGPMGAGIGAPSCSKGPNEVTVVVDVRLEPALAISPAWNFTVTAVAETERIG